MPISERPRGWRHGCLALLALGVVGCDRTAEDPRVAAGSVDASGADQGRIACRLGAAETFAVACTAERSASGAGQMLTLRGPDGGFHRVLVDARGKGVAAADGSEPATMSRAPDGGYEVAVGGDRYRLPANR